VTEHDAAQPLDAAHLAAWADELRAMAALGLIYAPTAYDRERYTRIQEIAAAIQGGLTGLGAREVLTLLQQELGYVTVKVGVAAAVLDQAGRMLLVHRPDTRLWAMPGGWADVGDSPAAMTAREVQEETGVTVRVDRLVGLYDSRRRGFGHAHHIYHIVFACTPVAGVAAVTGETLAVGWFGPEALPPLSPGHADPVRDAFRQNIDRALPTVFD
jgi:ADP-ribose pyrophosphatase YjhB (NUDIX family)